MQQTLAGHYFHIKFHLLNFNTSDQQKMYDHASTVARLLSPNTPEEDALNQIGDAVVSGYCLLPTFAKFMQRDAAAIIQKATIDRTPIHIPAILHSAAMEFDRAYTTGGDCIPQISKISEDDQRLKACSWNQPLFFGPLLGTHDGVSPVLSLLCMELNFSFYL